MKNLFYISLFVSSALFSQTPQKGDVKMPSESFGSSTSFGSHVNESTGKVSVSMPITNIAARSLTFPIEISYQGDNVLKQATYKNRHMATGILGVGWNIAFPKIIADYKNTATRDDDSFYLNGTALVCTSRPHPSLMMTGIKVWEFKLNSPSAYKVKYYDVSIDYDMTNFIVQKLDYWEVVDDKGRTYIYGNSDTTRESVLAWGNWIGDSKAAGAEKHTIVWNVAILRDQYNNNLQFSYLKTENGYSATSLKHTEASYVQQITSSTGEKIIFTYGAKSSYEYYEPHTEAVEPDAYQEHYEKSFLNGINTYNSSNGLVANHQFSYTILNPTVTESAKRYLQSITNRNASNNYLPPYTFEYYTTGDYKGHLKKRTNPNGGSITYTYTVNNLFTNSTNNVETNGIFGTGTPFGEYHSDKYILRLYSDVNIAWNADDMTTYANFYIVKDEWTGRKWVRSKFVIPDQIRVIYESGGYYNLDNAKFVFGDDYWACLVYNRNSDFGTLHMYHLAADGSWAYSGWSTIHTGGNNDSDASEDPVLISGDDFIAIGTNQLGKLFIYRWNDYYWYRETIEQGSGNYFYGARNNFIIALNTVSGTDMVTMDPPETFPHYDRYYIHFMDGEKKWQTKSWSAAITNGVSNVSGSSSFYPSNAMSSFVAADNPEFFIRWDTNYNIVGITNIGAYNDIYPFFPLVNNIFTGFRIGDTSRPKIFKLGAFDGVNWTFKDINHETHSGFGHNRVAGLAVDYSAHSLFSFNPNTTSWVEASLAYTSPPDFNYNNMDSFAFANDLFMSGDRIYRLNNNGYTQIAANSYFYYQQFAKSGGGEYLYDHHWRNDDPNDFDGDGNLSEYIGESKYYYLDKTTNNLVAVQLSETNVPSALNLYGNSLNRRAEQFGGKYPYFSGSNLRGRKLIDNQFNNIVKDIVLYEAIKDDGMGEATKMSYTFENSHTLADDETVIYGTVTIRDWGLMSGLSNGYIRKTFDNGATDASKAGFLLKEEYYAHGGTKLSDVIYTPTRYTNTISNSEGTVINTNFVWRATKRQELSYMGDVQVMDKTAIYTYDVYGNIVTESTQNSEGLTEYTYYQYADELFPFVAAKNFRGFVAKTTKSVGGEIVSIEKTNWVQNGSYAYINQNSSGTAESNIRLNNDVLALDNYGNVLETSNGKGISKSVLMGYNYKYVIATVNNVKHDDLKNSLQVSYATLQGYNAAQLKPVLLGLYSIFPKALISIDLYDNYGRVVTSIDSRKNEVNYQYDEFGRIKYSTDKNGNVVSAKKYNYKNQ